MMIKIVEYSVAAVCMARIVLNLCELLCTVHGQLSVVAVWPISSAWQVAASCPLTGRASTAAVEPLHSTT